MKYLSFFLCCLLSYIALGQNLSTQVSLLPAKPETWQKTLISYRPKQQISTTKLSCYLYQNSDQTRVTVLPLQNNHNQFTAEFTIDKDVKSFLMVFYDSSGVIDSNKGEGYWCPVYEKDKPVAGALATMADMYAGWRTNIFALDKKYDVALNLYQQEFAQHAYLKRKHYLFYLFALQGTGSFSKTQYKKALQGLTLFDDLTEVELTYLWKLFAEINENATAKEINRLRHEKYPEAGNVIESDNSSFYKEFALEKSFSKKKEMYDTFCARYADLKDTISIQRTQFRRGVMLANLSVYYIKEDRTNVWETELAKLNKEAQRTALHLASCDLYNKEAYLDKAEVLAQRACEIQLALFKTPRNWREPLDLTDEQVQYYRHKNASWTFQNYGLVLMKNNQMEKAVTVLKEAALVYGRGESSEINDAYIDALIKSGQSELAETEAVRFRKNQKSSPHIDAFLQQVNKSQSIYQSVDLKSNKNRVPVSLIDEPLSFFDFVDAEGKQVTKEALKGKIVIVDCWATWCNSCIVGFAGMYNLVTKYKDDPNVLFLFLNTSEFGGNAEEKAKNLMKRMNYDFNIVFDYENVAFDKLKLNGLPTKFVIDKKGNIRFRQVGETNGFVEKIDTVIEQLLE